MTEKMSSRELVIANFSPDPYSTAPNAFKVNISA
jgi:hypothetical protein